MKHLAAMLVGAHLAQALSPWAETPELSACADGSATCLLRSSWEIVRVGHDQVRPVDASIDAPASLDRALLGRRFSLLEEWAPPASVGFVMGNELGDQVLQEVPHGSSPENRNPASCVRIGSPASHPLRAFARLEQVDHFSDAWLGQRSRRLGHPDLGSPWPQRRFAWFGENLPPFSIAGAGLDWTGREGAASVSFQQGWIWQHLVLSDQLIPWEIHQTDAKARWRWLRWEHTERTLDHAHNRDIAADLSTGRVAIERFESTGITAGLSYRREAARGTGQTTAWRWTPWVEHRIDFGKWRWSGFHRADGDDHVARDTVSWSDSGANRDVRLGWAGQWSDAPDNVHPDLEAALTGRSFEVSAAEEQVHLLFAKLVGRRGRWEGAFETRPWAILAPRSFRIDSIDAEGRHGGIVALGEPLFGWKSGGLLRWTPARFCALEASLHHAAQWSKSADAVDLTPPVWTARTGARFQSLVGLSSRLQIGWTSSSIVRNLTPSARTVPARWSVDGWVEQKLFADRLTLALAALDLLADNRPDLPDGGQRRPRLLVSGAWQL